MNTTVYGDFHNATGSSNPETLVADYLASAPTEWRQQMEAIGAVDAIVEDYVSAIDAALPDNVWLSGSEFIGPHHTDEDYEDAPSMDDIRELLADIDLGAIVEKHGTAADQKAKQAIVDAAAGRAAAVKRLAEADSVLTETVVSALKLDIPATVVAEILGVTRARVYQIRDKQAAHERNGATAAPASVEDAIRAAYARLVPADDEWVGLAPLRAQLTAYTRDDVDAGLRALAKKRGVHIIPVANFKTLTQADRDAALLLGGQYSHAIGIERQ